MRTTPWFSSALARTWFEPFAFGPTLRTSPSPMNHLRRVSVLRNLARTILGPNGHDEYLEDIKTLWLIHWKISTNVQEPLFAWDRLLNFWHRPDFTRSEVINVFTEEANRQGKALSPVTLETHFTTFLHT